MDIATLSIKVKSDGIDDSVKGLEALAKAAANAETKTKDLDKTQKSSTGGTNASTSASDKFMESLKKQVAALDKNQEAIIKYSKAQSEIKAATLGISTSAQPMIDKIAEAETALLKTSNAGNIFNNTLKSMVVAALAYTGVNFAKSIVEQADAWVMMQSKLNIAVGSMEGAKIVQGELVELANKLRVPLADAAQLYTRMATPMTLLGKSAKETMGMVEGVSMALKLSGATGQEASSVMLQFSQSMNAGRLNGGEFNAVAEGAPIILRAIEAELRRVGMGAELAQKGIKKMATEGKLDTEILVGALTSGAFLARMKADFESLPLTVDGALTKVKNTWEQAVGKMGEDTQFTKGMVDGLKSIEDAIPSVVNALGTMLSVSIKLFSTIIEFTPIVIKGLLEIGLAFGAWKLGALITSMGGLSVAFTTTLAAIGVAIKAATVSWEAFTVAVMSNGVGLALTAIAVVVGGLALAYNELANAKEHAAEVEKAQEDKAQARVDGLKAENIQIMRQIDLLREKQKEAPMFTDEQKGIKPVKPIADEYKDGVKGLLASQQILNQAKLTQANIQDRINAGQTLAGKSLENENTAAKENVKNWEREVAARTEILEKSKLGVVLDSRVQIDKNNSLHGKVEELTTSKDDKKLKELQETLDKIQKRKKEQDNYVTGLEDEEKIKKAIKEIEDKKKDSPSETLAPMNAVLAKMKEQEESQRRMLVNEEQLSTYREQKGLTTPEQGSAERESIIADRLKMEQDYLTKQLAAIKSFHYSSATLQAEAESKKAGITLQFNKLKSDEEMRQTKLSIDAESATTDALVKEYEKRGEFLLAFEAKRRASHEATQASPDVSPAAKATEQKVFDTDKAIANNKTVAYSFTELATTTENALKGVKTATEGFGLDVMLNATVDASNQATEAIEKLRQKLLESSDPKQIADLNKELVRIGESQRQLWDSVGKSISDSLTSAFGETGKSIGGMISSYMAFGQMQQKIDAQKKTDMLALDKLDPADKEKATAALNIEYSKKEASARLKSYGDMAGAAKGFFKENSNGYNLLKNTEMAFRAFEIAEALSSFAIKSGLLTTFLGLFVGSAAAQETTTVATEAVKQGAYSTSALAAALTIPPPFGWIAMGITAAALASIGISASKGSVPSGMNMEDPANKQKMQGTGTVLGDSSAKSEFIAKSIDILAKNSGLGLIHTNSMMNSMKSVAANIGAFVGDIARTSGVLGASTAGIDERTVSTLGKLFGGTSTTIDDKGLSVSKGTIGDVKKQGLNVQGYTQVSEDSFWKGSKDYRVLQALPDASKGISGIIVNLSKAITEGANALGLGGDEFQKHLDSFVVSINDISAKGLTGTEFEKQVQAEISKIGDQMAEFALPQLKEFGITVGTGMGEAIATLVNNLQQVKDVFAVLNKPMTLIGLDAIRMSEQLVKAAGGTEALTSSVKFYVDNFLKGNDLIQPSITNALELQSELAKSYAMSSEQAQLLGGSSVITKDQLVDLVKGVDLTTLAGAELFTKLMQIAPAIKTVADAVKDAQDKFKEANDNANSALATAGTAYQNFVDNVTSTTEKLVKAGDDIMSKYLQSQKDAETANDKVVSTQSKITDGYLAAGKKVAEVQKQITKGLNDMAFNISKFVDTMQTTDIGGLSKTEQLKNQREIFLATSEKAKNGDFTIGNELPKMAENMLKLMESTSSSSVDFARGAAEIKSQLLDVVGITNSKTGGEEKSKAQQLADDLLAAQAEQAMWSDAIVKSGSSFTKQSDDLLAEYNKAIEAQKDAVFANKYWASVVKDIGLTMDKNASGLSDTQAATAKSGKDLIDAYYKASADSKNAVEDLKAANIIRNGIELHQATALENFVTNIKDVNEKAKLASEAAKVLFDLAAKNLVDGSELSMKEAKDGMAKWQDVIEKTAKGIADSVLALQNNAAATIANIKQSLEDAKKVQAGGIDAGKAGVDDLTNKSEAAKKLAELQSKVLAQYSLLGRNNIGSEANQVDTKGFNYWVDQLSSGKLSIDNLNKVFMESAAKYSEADASKYQSAIDSAKQLITPPPPPMATSIPTIKTDNAELLAAVVAMKGEITEMKNDQRIGDLANVQATKSVHKLLNDVTDQGTALYTTPAA